MVVLIFILLKIFFFVQLLSEPILNQVNSISNEFTFNTLRKPHFEILMISSDNVYLSIFFYCKLILEEKNVNYFFKKVDNACHQFKLLVKQQKSDVIKFIKLNF